jgi:flagellar biosynthesis chaperone FliJ
MRINKTSALSSIKLNEKAVPTEVQVLRVGKFNHPIYGNFEITPQTLSEMKANFEAQVRGIDVAFDYFHKSDEEAAGWPQALELRENGQELWATQVEWTPKASRKLSDREVRYFSPDFAFQWTDPETNTKYNNVLFGGGLTNRPFVKEMKAIVADEIKGENVTELEKAQAKVKEQDEQIKKLSEEKGAVEAKMADMVPKPAAGDDVVALKAQIAQLQAELAKAKGDSEAALAEKAKAQEAAKLAEKTSEFNVLLSEGKAVAAQKDAFLKGNMTEFIKLAQPVNLQGKGSGASDAPIEESDANAIIKLAEAKQKENPKLSRGDAISIAKKELKK